jgi:serine/threonine protein phosphatase PrpC
LSPRAPGALAGDETVEDCLDPIVVGEAKPRPFESKHVDAAKYITPRFTPDTIIDAWQNDFLTLRGASIRGNSHRWEKIPRQDSFATAFVPHKNWVVVAVADGVSAAPQSHIGAAIAVDSAISYFVNTPTADVERLDWRQACEVVARRLTLKITSLRDHPIGLDKIGDTESDVAGAALTYLATTLVCAVITPNQHAGGLVARVIAVGDSGVWLLSGAKFHAAAGGKEDGSGITSNDVAPLPYVPPDLAPVKVAVKPGEVLLLGTDGFGEPLGSGDGELGRLFRSALEPVPTALRFANTLDFTRKYFVDDRTLVAVWPREHKDAK